MKLNYNLILGLVLFSSVLNAQKDIATQYGSWWNYSGNHQLSEKISINTIYSWRLIDFVKNWQQSLFRLGVNYDVNENFSVSIGYDWAHNFVYGDQPAVAPFNDHRIFQHFSFKSNNGRFYLDHRYRFEQRFIEVVSVNSQNEKVSDGYHFRQRVRYQFGITVPLSKPKLEDNTLFLRASDEIFINFGKGTATNMLDQNWFNVAIGWRFNKDFNVTIGYQNQFFVKGDGQHIERNHLLNLGITYNFDLRKK